VYTVKRAAELTGIAPDTLRKWERRYGVVTPVRSEGGYRLYDDRALRRLAAMKSLVASGLGAAQAAQRVAEGDQGSPTPSRPLSAAGLGDVLALARVAGDFDVAALDAALDAGFAQGTFEEVADGWLMPSMANLGVAWREGSVTVAGEHFVTASVQRRLAALFDGVQVPAGSVPVVVGLPSGSRHEIGILAFATALRRAGIDVVYVGGDLPPEEWVATVGSRSAAAAVLGVASAEDVPAVRETVAMLAAAYPQVRSYVGGSHQSAVGPPAHELGHGIGPAAQHVAQALHQGEPSRPEAP